MFISHFFIIKYILIYLRGFGKKKRKNKIHKLIK